MTSKKKAALIVDALSKEYSTPEFPPTELIHSNPLELLIATVLSAQCTDARVNTTTETLFKKYKSAADYARAPEGVLEADIGSINFFNNKAKNIRALGEKLAREHAGKVPKTLGELTALPGVGRKTANIVLSIAFGKAALAVDTHVKRVSTRLGLATSNDPDKIEAELTALIDKGWWVEATRAMIYHGRRVCKARRPLCGECIVSRHCDYYASEVKNGAPRK